MLAQQWKEFENNLDVPEEALKHFKKFLALDSVAQHDITIRGRPAKVHEFEVPIIAYLLLKKRYPNIMREYTDTIYWHYQAKRALMDEQRKAYYDKFFPLIHGIDPEKIELVLEKDRLRVKIKLD